MVDMIATAAAAAKADAAVTATTIGTTALNSDSVRDGSAGGDRLPTAADRGLRTEGTFGGSSATTIPAQRRASISTWSGRSAGVALGGEEGGEEEDNKSGREFPSKGAVWIRDGSEVLHKAAAEAEAAEQAQTRDSLWQFREQVTGVKRLGWGGSGDGRVSPITVTYRTLKLLPPASKKWKQLDTPTCFGLLLSALYPREWHVGIPVTHVVMVQTIINIACVECCHILPVHCAAIHFTRQTENDRLLGH